MEIVKPVAKALLVTFSFEDMKKPRTVEPKNSWPRVKKMLEKVFNCKRVGLALPKTTFLERVKRENFINLILGKNFLAINESCLVIGKW